MTCSSRQASQIALQNWWILICHRMKMCHETGKSGNTEEIEQKWTIRENRGKRDVSKKYPWSSGALFWENHCYCLPCPFSLPCLLRHHAFQKQPSYGEKSFSYFWLWRHIRGPGVSALFSGARYFLLQMKTTIHPQGWIINNAHP